LGSGTTSLAAKNLGRNSIGYEINKDFKSIIQNKLSNEQLSMLDDAKIIFTDDNVKKDFRFDNLPYIFHDPHKMDKKIDNKSVKKEELYTVKSIISPNSILLNNGLEVKLLGINPKKGYEEKAKQFLSEKFNKRRIYMKFDNNKYDSKNNLQAYVYLDNRTFINNHLIRTGFVEADLNSDYSYKNKFLAGVKNG